MKKVQPIREEKDRVLIKFVKFANCYCKTTFLKGKQKQEWFSDKPT